MGRERGGESTLLKCLFGIYKKTAAALCSGREIDFKGSEGSVGTRRFDGTSELNLVLQRTDGQHGWGAIPTKGLFVDQDKMFKDTRRSLTSWISTSTRAKRVDNLSVSQMQMIEIAKAFSYDAKIVIMDEPTSSLTEKEVNHLFTIIRKLKERGCGIVYISHKMEEIFQLCDEITVLRDGQWIATQPLEGLDGDKIIAMMVGRSLSQRFPDRQTRRVR